MKSYKMFAVVSFGLLSVGYTPAADKCPENKEIIKKLESLKETGKIHTAEGDFVFSQDLANNFNGKRLNNKDALSHFMVKEVDVYQSRKLESEANSCAYSLTYTLNQEEKKSVLPKALNPKESSPAGDSAVIVLHKE